MNQDAYYGQPKMEHEKKQLTERDKFVAWIIGFGIAALLAMSIITNAEASTLDQYYNSGGDTEETFGTSAGAKWASQTFTPTAGNILDFAKFQIYRTGAAHDVTVDLKATDVNGKPTGSALTTATISAASIGTSWSWAVATFTEYEMTADTKYALVLHCNACTNSEYINWNTDESSPTYTGGNTGWSTDSGSTWTMYDSIDSMFETWTHSAAAATSTTATTTTTIVQNPTQDLFNGILLFFVAFGATIFGLTKTQRKGVMT